MTATPHNTTNASRTAGILFLLKTAFINAVIALVLFSLMIGVRTEAGPEGKLIYWTRFGDLALLVGAVFVGSIAVELVRRCSSSVAPASSSSPVASWPLSTCSAASVSHSDSSS